MRGGNTYYIDKFVLVGELTGFRTSTQYLTPGKVCVREIAWIYSGIMRSNTDMFDGHSVRCVKDESDQ